MVPTPVAMIRQAGLCLSVSSKRVLNVSVCHKPRFGVNSDTPLCHNHGIFSLQDRDLHGRLLLPCESVSTHD